MQFEQSKNLNSHAYTNKMTARKFSYKGFSLIEIAVVLFIITLVIGGITQYINAQLVASKITATNEKQQAIKAALISFVSRNNRLPCPADITIPDGAGNAGTETPNPGICTGAIIDTGTTVASGEVPWTALGLPLEDSLDGYANRFTYQVALTATNLNAQTITSMTGAISIHNSYPPTLGSPIATYQPGNQLNDCRANMTVAYASNANPCAAVVVIVSHGADGFGAYNNQGVQINFPPQVTGQEEWENSKGSATNKNPMFIIEPYSANASDPFDDVLLFLTPSDVLVPLINSGSMQSARASINAEFNILKTAIIGYALQSPSPIVADGVNSDPGPTPPGCGANPNPPCNVYYQYTLPSALLNLSLTHNLTGTLATDNNGNPLDPWGQLIQYSYPIQTFSSPTTPDSSVAFTLTSSGPDNTFGTPDDISINVYVGEIRQQSVRY